MDAATGLGTSLCRRFAVRWRDDLPQADFPVPNPANFLERRLARNWIPCAKAVLTSWNSSLVHLIAT
jgi:hypothetical protein